MISYSETIFFKLIFNLGIFPSRLSFGRLLADVLLEKSHLEGLLLPWYFWDGNILVRGSDFVASPDTFQPSCFV